MEKILFVTGKLAEEPLKATLSDLKLGFSFKVQALGIDVAALMTTGFISKRIEAGDCTKVIIPGLCRGELSLIEKACGVEVERGPKDLRNLPDYFGFKVKREGFGKYRMKILAEILDVPYLSLEEIEKRAEYYVKSGADIIDLGCTTEKRFENVSRVVSHLKDEGFKLSIDTFDEMEILNADEAGIDYVLSLNSNNIKVASRLDSIPVVIPDFDAPQLESLKKNIAYLEEMGMKYIIDPILNPINFGFSESLFRFWKVRSLYPKKEMLCGLGNLTELLDADSTGISAILTGFLTELGIEYVLTTEASDRTRGCVKELDKARKLMYYSHRKKLLPKNLDDSLITIKDRKINFFEEQELLKMQKKIRDENFRIFTDKEYIYLFNSKIFLKGRGKQELFDKLEIKDPSHAFYLGCELERAELALKLGKNYLQEQPLKWGYLGD
ncbi:MAG: DUF6513 domain-containing protein [Candidatus Methanofastidiosia archaeon]